MKKIGKIILVIAIIITCGTVGNVYASSFNFTTSASSTTLKPGDTVTLELKVSKIDVGESGINTIEAVLDYDKTIFEPVTSTSFAGLNNWSITYNGEEGANKGKLVAVIVQEGVKVDQTIGKLTLKVKAGIKDSSTKVTFKDIKTNDGVNEITTANQVTNIDIKNPVEELPKPDKEPDKTPKPDTSPEKIPQTGENSYLILGIVVIILIIGISSYVAYRKNNI